MAVAVRAQTGSPGKGCGKAAAWKTKNRFSTALGNPAKRRGIPTFPQPRRRSIDHEPDISCATKTGHFNLLTTGLRFVEPATQLGPPYSVFTQRSYTVEVSFNFEALQYFVQQATPGPSGE